MIVHSYVGLKVLTITPEPILYKYIYIYIYYVYVQNKIKDFTL